MTYTLNQVRCSLEKLAAVDPSHVDDRAGRGLAPRYTEHGKPCCLVANVMIDLGIKFSVLRSLDREGEGRRRPNGGIELKNTKNPIRKQFERDAWSFMCHAQHLQDRQVPWGEIIAELDHRDEFFRRY